MTAQLLLFIELYIKTLESTTYTTWLGEESIRVTPYTALDNVYWLIDDSKALAQVSISVILFVVILSAIFKSSYNSLGNLQIAIEIISLSTMRQRSYKRHKKCLPKYIWWGQSKFPIFKMAAKSSTQSNLYIGNKYSDVIRLKKVYFTHILFIYTILSATIYGDIFRVNA